MTTKSPSVTPPPIYRQAAEVVALLERAQTERNPVGDRSTRSSELLTIRALPRALMGGTDAMRRAGQAFLIRHEAEADKAFDSRLNMTTLYGAFKETVCRQVGKVFQDEIILNPNVPQQIKTLCEDDIDGQGRALSPFMMESLMNGMVDGIHFIMVEFPELPPNATLADQQTAKARPYWIGINANDILGWRTEVRGGMTVLTQVRIMEETVEPDGRYGEVKKRRVRVLEPGRYELWEWRKGNDGRENWFLERTGTTALPDKIALVAIYTNRVGYFDGEPPLMPLADLCKEHWNSSSEQRRALSFARFAMLFLAGIDADAKIAVGPDKIIKAAQGSQAGYIEPSGSATEAGRKDLEDIERRMQSSGMTLRVENSGKVTATASAIDTSESNAGLRAVAKGMEDSINLLLQYTAEMLGMPSGGTVKVFDEFADPASREDVDVLLAMRQGGDLSRLTLLQEMKRRRVLDDEMNPYDEVTRIEAEPPPLPALPQPGGQPEGKRGQP